MASSGPVLGLQDCQVVLPNVLSEFRQICQQLTSAAQQSHQEHFKSTDSNQPQGISEATDSIAVISSLQRLKSRMDRL
jgi:hypothetical protein